MKKIDESLISYIQGGDPQDADTLNRPTKDLIQQLENFEFPDEIVGELGDSETKVIHQKKVTEQLTGWGTTNPPLATEGFNTRVNGVYRMNVGTSIGNMGAPDGPSPGTNEDGTLLVLGDNVDQIGSSKGQLEQLCFYQNKIQFRQADHQDQNGEPVWSSWKELQYKDDLGTPMTGSFVGQILSGPFRVIPEGWKELNGQTLTRQNYPALQQFVNDYYQSHSSNKGAFYLTSTNIRLPDMKGLFVRGHGDYDSNRKSASAVGQVQEDAFKSHNHSFTRGATSRGKKSDRAWADGTHRTITTSSVGDTETRPINVGWRYIIRVV